MKKLLTGLVVVMMIVTMTPMSLMESLGMKVEAAVTLRNPKIEPDSSMDAGQTVTYDCVWFGKYPQTEIVDSAERCGTSNKGWGKETDYEVNSNLYTTLQNSSGWDSNGDITISGVEYRRLKKGDATYATSSGMNYFEWSDSNTYHYFRYDPIKWRILDITDNQATLIADIVIDCQRYNKEKENTSVTWAKSTIRSWLNGYNSSYNNSSIDYTNSNFIDTAFSYNEKNGIVSTTLNNTSIGGSNTTDKIYLLSVGEISKGGQTSYGFSHDEFNYDDEASKRKSSTYAKAMGQWSGASLLKHLGYGAWWLRSSQGYNGSVIMPTGNIFSPSFSDGLIRDVFYGDGICPTLKIDLSFTDLYTYAGKVSSSGVVSYTVTYNANGGTEAPSNQKKTEGTDLIISNAKPNRNGYTFLGWGTSSNSTNVAYNPGDTYSIDEDITLYALWMKTITLNYDANGGTGAPSSQKRIIYNSATNCSMGISAKKPTRSGYTFIGWNTSNNATSAKYVGEEVVTLSSDITLYAIWEKTITLSYDANGGDGAPYSQSATVYNSTTNYDFTISNTIPLRTNYTFLGWSTSSNAKTASCVGGNTISLGSDTTLYAVWKNESGEGGDSGDEGSSGDDPVNPEPKPTVKKAQTINASDQIVPINGQPFNINAVTDGNGKLTYKSSNNKVVTVNSAGKITIKAYGKANITITAAETSTYKKATKTVTITVVPKKMKLKSVKSPAKLKLQAKWTKDKTAGGYELQISEDWQFNSKKYQVYRIAISKKKSSVKASVKNILKSKKKYYVRIRAWNKVSGQKLYGIWSYGKVVKIK